MKYTKKENIIYFNRDIETEIKPWLNEMNNSIKGFFEDITKEIYKKCWDDIEYIDPTKIKVSETIWNIIYESLINQNSYSKDQQIAFGFQMVNNGPSMDKTLKPNQIRLIDNWISFNN